MKIYRRVRAWIMFASLVLIPPIAAIIAVATGNGDAGIWDVSLIESMILFFLITVYAAVIAAESVAAEFTWGTVKLLLIRPWSRSSILLAKFLAVLLFTLLLTVMAGVAVFATNAAVFGYTASEPFQPYSDYGGAMSAIAIYLQYYLFQFIALVVIISLAFMISSAFRSSALAIAISLVLLFVGSIFTQVLAMINKPWVDYVLFLHLDLTPYINGGKYTLMPNSAITLGFSLAVLAAYFIVFTAVSWIVFNKRDITA